MHDPRVLIALALILGGLVAFDHLRKIKTGAVRTRLAALRQRQPGGFRRYFYSDWTVLGFCVGVIAYALLLGCCRKRDKRPPAGLPPGARPEVEGGEPAHK